MRVALLSPLYESVPPRLYGGTERVVANLCRGLTKVNVEVVLFAAGDSVCEGKLESVVPQALRLKNKPVIDPVPYNFKMLAQIAKRADEFDVIHNHHDYWMLPLSAMTDTPVLTTLHGRMDMPDQEAAFLSYPRVHYVSISDAQRRPFPQLRWLKTIHHGIDLDELPFHKKAGTYLAFLGRITPEKRPDWAIEIAKRAGVPLKIAAKIEGPHAQEYFDSCIKPHIDGKFIEFVGEISEAEKVPFLGNAMGLVFPIDWPEPFGLVIIEALACGTPVLARPFGSVPELLLEGVTGFVNSDIRILAKRVHDLPKISRKTCRAWVEKKFSLQRMTEEYLHVFRQLTAKGLGANSHRWDFLHSVQRTADGNL